MSDPSILAALPYTAAGTVAGMIGGVAAIFWRPNKAITSDIQHFAAGVVLAAGSLELLPTIDERHAAIWAVLGGFAAGAFAMYFLRKWADAQEAKAGVEGGIGGNAGLIGATSIDETMDGITVGTTFAVGGSSSGIVLAIGLSLELLFLGLSITSTIGGRNTSRWAVFSVIAGIALLFTVGAIGSLAVIGGVGTDISTAVLSFGAAALLYLVTEELLTEAHEKSVEATNTLILFLGFGALWLVRLLLD